MCDKKVYIFNNAKEVSICSNINGKNMKKLHFATAALAVAISSNSFAEVSSETPNEEVSQTTIGWTVMATVGGVTDEAQLNNGIGDSVWGLNFGANWDIQSNWNAEAGLVIYNFDDQDEFSQDTQSVWGGDIDSSTSDVVGIGVYGEFGYLHKLSTENDFTVGANLGYEYLDVNREIGSCVDCYSEDVDLDGGLYLRPFASMKLGSSTALEVSYKHPFSDEGLESVIQFGVIFTP